MSSRHTLFALFLMLFAAIVLLLVSSIRGVWGTVAGYAAPLHSSAGADG